MANNAFQLLTFYLGAEEYGLPLVQAREILGIAPTTMLPNAPKHVVGLINLRGEILPVFDLRLLFKLQSKSHVGEQDCILVAETLGEPFGLRVDGVHQVLTLSPEQIDPPSDALRDRSAAISGLAKVGSRLVILLDSSKLFSEEEGVEHGAEVAETVRHRRDA
jgi:purine-binding chemotaxis protein CheW